MICSQFCRYFSRCSRYTFTLFSRRSGLSRRVRGAVLSSGARVTSSLALKPWWLRTPLQLWLLRLRVLYSNSALASKSLSAKSTKTLGISLQRCGTLSSPWQQWGMEITRPDLMVVGLLESSLPSGASFSYPYLLLPWPTHSLLRILNCALLSF